MNLQAQTIIPTVGAVVVHYRGSNPPMDSIFVDGKEVARLREEPLPCGGSVVVALDLEECEARGFSLERDPWLAAAEWLLRRAGCTSRDIVRAINEYDAAEKASREGELCDARR